MSVMRDLIDPRWMYLKAGLLLAILIACCVVLWLEMSSLRTVFLLTLVVWSSARLYYFMFYVVERYIDPTYRFSGIGSAIQYFLRRSRNRE